MADRKEYYRQWFQKNKVEEIKKSLARREKLKIELGEEKFKEWERERNKKQRDRVNPDRKKKI